MSEINFPNFNTLLTSRELQAKTIYDLFRHLKDVEKDSEAYNALRQEVQELCDEIRGLDPSMSEEEAIQALAAKQAVVEADLSALGPKINQITGGEVDVEDFSHEYTVSGSNLFTDCPNITDLSPYEVGKTYKITIVANESCTIRIKTRDSSNTDVQTIASAAVLVEGGTYTFDWTRQSSETRLFSDSSGLSYKCVFTISHKAVVGGALNELSGNVTTIGNKLDSLDEYVRGEEITIEDYTKTVTSPSNVEFVDIQNLSPFEVGKTYRIVVVANEDAVIQITTRDSSSQTVNSIASGYSVTQGQTYTFNWTRQSNEARLFSLAAGGVGYKCEFTIEHDTTTGGINETLEELGADVQAANARTESVEADVNDINEELDGTKEEQTGYSLFTIASYIKTDGSDVVNPSWIRSDFIPLEDFVSCTVWLHSSVTSIAFYSAKNLASFLGYAGTGTYGTEGTFSKNNVTIPEGSAYVIISTENLGSTRPYTDSSITTLVTTQKGIKQKVQELIDGQGKSHTNKGFAHISFDDVVYCLHDITENEDTYTSIFDNPFFALLKRLHDTYGAVFSLFVFLEDAITGEHATGWTLAGTTTNFAVEFAENADWLKFGLHALNRNSNYASRSAADAATDYNSFVTSIMAITGTTESIDRLPRLGNFAGGLDQMIALRDCDAGIVGGLAAYDSRDSYYLTSAESALAYKNGMLIDATNHLAFYTSLNALEGSSPNTLFAAKNTPATMGRFFNLEWMMHEYAIGGQDFGFSSYDWDTMADRLENACKISANNGYTWKFPFAAALEAGL